VEYAGGGFDGSFKPFISDEDGGGDDPGLKLEEDDRAGLGVQAGRAVAVSAVSGGQQSQEDALLDFFDASAAKAGDLVAHGEDAHGGYFSSHNFLVTGQFPGCYSGEAVRCFSVLFVLLNTSGWNRTRLARFEHFEYNRRAKIFGVPSGFPVDHIVFRESAFLVFLWKGCMVPSENVISVVCDCGKRLKGPASAAGKKARCPACGTTLLLSPGGISADAIPTPSQQGVRSNATPATAVARTKTARPVPLPVPAAAHEEDDLGAMYELAQQANVAETNANIVVCPQCRAVMDDQAVLCTNCGYDTRTGKSLAVDSAPVPVNGKASAKAGKKAGKPMDYMAADGSIVMGIVLSAVFALLASLVWIGVAWATGFAIGYIAILIGGAAGVGMQIGHKGYSKAGGVIAAFMTLGAIIVAKVVVLELILARNNESISNINGSRLGLYFFSPIGLIIIAVGVSFAFKTANGGSK
jgi:hypothetical protein